MARTSAAALEVQGAVAIVRRPDPPLYLTPEQTDEWVAVADSMPADWFKRETHSLLEQWCRHTVDARRIAQLLDQEMSRDPVDIGALDKLLAMQARETSAMKALASAMRISQQASYTTQRAGTQKAGRAVKRPWE
jgi:hypothetical protein